MNLEIPFSDFFPHQQRPTQKGVGACLKSDWCGPARRGAARRTLSRWPRCVRRDGQRRSRKRDEMTRQPSQGPESQPGPSGKLRYTHSRQTAELWARVVGPWCSHFCPLLLVALPVCKMRQVRAGCESPAASALEGAAWLVLEQRVKDPCPSGVSKSAAFGDPESGRPLFCLRRLAGARDSLAGNSTGRSGKTQPDLSMHPHQEPVCRHRGDLQGLADCRSGAGLRES